MGINKFLNYIIVLIVALFSLFSCIGRNENNLIVKITPKTNLNSIISGIIIDYKYSENDKDSLFLYIATSYQAYNKIFRQNNMDEDDIDIHFFSNNLLEMEGIPKIFREIETDKPSEPEDTDKRRLIIFEVKIKIKKPEYISEIEQKINEKKNENLEKLNRMKNSDDAANLFTNENYLLWGIDPKGNQIKKTGEFHKIELPTEIQLKYKDVLSTLYGSGIFSKENLLAVIYDIKWDITDTVYYGVFYDTILDQIGPYIQEGPLPTREPRKSDIWIEPVWHRQNVDDKFCTDIYIYPEKTEIAEFKIKIKYNNQMNEGNFPNIFKIDKTKGNNGVETGENFSLEGNPVINEGENSIVIEINGKLKQEITKIKKVHLLRICWISLHEGTEALKTDSSIRYEDSKELKKLNGLVGGGGYIGFITIYGKDQILPTPIPGPTPIPTPKPVPTIETQAGDIWISVQSEPIIKDNIFSTDIFFKYGDQIPAEYEFCIYSTNQLFRIDESTYRNNETSGIKEIYSEKDKKVYIKGVGGDNETGNKVLHLGTIIWKAIKEGKDKIQLDILLMKDNKQQNMKVNKKNIPLAIEISGPLPTPVMTPASTSIPLPTELTATKVKIRLQPGYKTVRVNDIFKTDILVKTGDVGTADFNFILKYNSNIIIVNDSIGFNGVKAGEYTNIENILPDNKNGILQVSGILKPFNSSGEYSHILSIYWKAIARGETEIDAEGNITYLSPDKIKIKDTSFNRGKVMVKDELPPPTIPPLIPTPTPAGILKYLDGDVWIKEPTRTIKVGDSFIMDIFVNVLDKKLYSYVFTITYNRKMIDLNTLKAMSGVEILGNSFLDSVKPNYENNKGFLEIKGENKKGVTSNEQMPFLRVYWIAKNPGKTTITLKVTSLLDFENTRIGNYNGDECTLYIESTLTSPGPTPEPGTTREPYTPEPSPTPEYIFYIMEPSDVSQIFEGVLFDIFGIYDRLNVIQDLSRSGKLLYTDYTTSQEKKGVDVIIRFKINDLNWLENYFIIVNNKFNRGTWNLEIQCQIDGRNYSSNKPLQIQVIPFKAAPSINSKYWININTAKNAKDNFNFSDARLYYEKARDFYPYDPQITLAYAESLYYGGYFDEAVEALSSLTITNEYLNQSRNFDNLKNNYLLKKHQLLYTLKYEQGYLEDALMHLIFIINEIYNNNMGGKLNWKLLELYGLIINNYIKQNKLDDAVTISQELYISNIEQYRDIKEYCIYFINLASLYIFKDYKQYKDKIKEEITNLNNSTFIKVLIKDFDEYILKGSINLLTERGKENANNCLLLGNFYVLMGDYNFFEGNICHAKDNSGAIDYYQLAKKVYELSKIKGLKDYIDKIDEVSKKINKCNKICTP